MPFSKDEIIVVKLNESSFLGGMGASYLNMFVSLPQLPVMLVGLL